MARAAMNGSAHFRRATVLLVFLVNKQDREFIVRQVFLRPPVDIITPLATQDTGQSTPT